MKRDLNILRKLIGKNLYKERIMAEVKGKFIVLACSLMGAYPKAQEEANQFLKKTANREWTELEQEGWYDTDIFNEIMNLYAKSSISGKTAIVTLGRKVYPTIKKSGGIPAHINTPLQLIKFEADGFLQNHRGNGVVPRTILKAVEKEVRIKAPAPGYSELLYEGVYMGILEMTGLTTGKVENVGDSTFKITW
ncbi:MAG: hypothetical protein A2Z99_02255 [Treponema sp. GWB1_62_6]|nr:MAG: hypothetical protein A2Z99_02255 [Treponema sp. GWB1_62_6]